MNHLLEKVISKIQDQKAEGDLIFSSSKSLRMSAQKGAISEYKVSSSQILGVRVIKDSRVGISYTEALDDKSIDFLVKQAIQNAEMSEPNPNEHVLPLTGEVVDEAHYDDREVSVEQKTERALWLESEVKRRDLRVTAVPHNSYSEGEFFEKFLSTRGRYTSYGDKSYTIVSSALLDEKGKKASYYDHYSSHTFQDLQWEKVIETSLYHAKNILLEKSIPTGRYKVRFSPDRLRDLLGCFSNLYSAKSAMDKVNPWEAKLGEEVMSKDLSIIDDPLFERSFRVLKFDSEGVEKKPLKLVEDGVLKTFLHNSSTAKHFQTQTTGHGARGAGSSLGVSGTHTLIHGKNVRPLPAEYLEVIEMAGLHSGANRITGDFSFAAKGYVWERGERKMTFGNVTVSGNVLELLRHVEVSGHELEASTDRSFFSVPLTFDGLTVAGT